MTEQQAKELFRINIATNDARTILASGHDFLHKVQPQRLCAVKHIAREQVQQRVARAGTLGFHAGYEEVRGFSAADERTLAAEYAEQAADRASEALAFARTTGLKNLLAMDFQQRAERLKALAKYLVEHKDELYAVSAHTGATRADGWIDIEGGAGTLFSYASKGRRELPNDTILIDGDPEIVSKGGTFIGQQTCDKHWRIYSLPSKLIFDDRFDRLDLGAADVLALDKDEDAVSRVKDCATQAVCVDDARQGVDEVVRAEDLLSSAARQSLIQDLLGLPAMMDLRKRMEDRARRSTPRRDAK